MQKDCVPESKASQLALNIDTAFLWLLLKYSASSPARRGRVTAPCRSSTETSSLALRAGGLRAAPAALGHLPEGLSPLPQSIPPGTRNPLPSGYYRTNTPLPSTARPRPVLFPRQGLVINH